MPRIGTLAVPEGREGPRVALGNIPAALFPWAMDASFDGASLKVATPTTPMVARLGVGSLWMSMARQRWLWWSNWARVR